MKLLDRYLMAQFARNLALVLAALVSIYLLVDFFERVDNFLEAGKGVGLTVKYLLFRLPAICDQLLPVCILLAGVITLGVLNLHFEFMALMASGISVFRIIRPLLVAGGLVTLLAVAAGQWLLPPTSARANRIWFEEVNRQVPRGIIREGRTFYRGSDGIFTFVRPDPAKYEFLGFCFAAFDEQQGLTTLLTARTATWRDGVWHFTDGQIKERGKNGDAIQVFSSYERSFAETPDDLFMPPYKVKELSYIQLLREGNREQRPDGGARQEFHRRLSYIFLGMPLLLLGLPVLLSMHRSRGRDLALAIPISCGLAFAVWGGWNTGQSLAQAGALPLLPAAWAMHFLAGGAGLFLLHRHNRG
ncbi:MAG: LptF/LptG family permease [Thermodesulfobacteriota bacterium]